MTSVNTGVASAARTVSSVVCPSACSLPLPGPISGPTTQITSGSAIRVPTPHRIPKRSVWLGSAPPSAAWPPDAAAGLDDIQETVHVAHRLHRAAQSVGEAGRAGNEALPA